jgi:hypothetical protein
VRVNIAFSTRLFDCDPKTTHRFNGCAPELDWFAIFYAARVQSGEMPEKNWPARNLVKCF